MILSWPLIESSFMTVLYNGYVISGPVVLFDAKEYSVEFSEMVY